MLLPSVLVVRLGTLLQWPKPKPKLQTDAAVEQKKIVWAVDARTSSVSELRREEARVWNGGINALQIPNRITDSNCTSSRNENRTRQTILGGKS